MRKLSDLLPKRSAYETAIAGREVRIVPRVVGWTWEIPSLEKRGGWCPSRFWAEVAADWWLFKEFEAW